jgi:hypothetical protein
VPADWPGGVGHGGGASPVCGFCMERGKADADTAVLVLEGAGVARGSAPGGGNREALSTGRWGMSEPQDKPCEIPKRLVWEAYERVEANKGAAGVDRQSIDYFESDLRDNLYKIWNRMSSGTYFPPPVMAVIVFGFLQELRSKKR